jgi:hypothetical protein
MAVSNYPQMNPKLLIRSAGVFASLSLTALDASAYGCVRAGGERVNSGGAVVYHNGGYGSYAYGGCYGAGFAAGGGPAALVGGPQSNPNFIPIPTVAPSPPPQVDPLDDQTIQDGPYSPGVYGRPAEQSGTPLGN